MHFYATLSKRRLESIRPHHQRRRSLFTGMWATVRVRVPDSMRRHRSIEAGTVTHCPVIDLSGRLVLGYVQQHINYSLPGVIKLVSGASSFAGMQEGWGVHFRLQLGCGVAKTGPGEVDRPLHVDSPDDATLAGSRTLLHSGCQWNVSRLAFDVSPCPVGCCSATSGAASGSDNPCKCHSNSCRISKLGKPPIPSS